MDVAMDFFTGIYVWKITCILLILMLQILSVIGTQIQGHLKTSENWHYLTRYCFLSNKGTLEFEFTYPQTYETQNVLLYFPDQWASVYGKTNQNCYEKEAVLRPENNQVINLTTRYTWSGCKIHHNTGTTMLHCKGRRSFRSAREIMWHIAVSNCETTKGLDLHYKMTMSNGQGNEFLDDSYCGKYNEMVIGIVVPVCLLVLVAAAVIIGFVVRHKLQHRSPTSQQPWVTANDMREDTTITDRCEHTEH